MQTVILDFSTCRSLDDIHQMLKTRLDFPDYYGMNLDALWDCLTGWIETPVTVVFRGVSALPKDLREEAEEMLDVFIRAELKEGVLYVVTLPGDVRERPRVTVTIDFSDCRTIDEVERVVRTAMQISHRVGGSLQAQLHDLLKTLAVPTNVVFHGIAFEMPKPLLNYAIKIEEVFRQAEAQYGTVHVV